MTTSIVDGIFILDPASTFKFFSKCEEGARVRANLPDPVHLLNPASLDFDGFLGYLPDSGL